MQSTSERFEFGDQVRHSARPEWGVGTVTAVENVDLKGETAQRLKIRFRNAGMKTLLTAQANLERVSSNGAAHDLLDEGESLADLTQMEESDWLSGIAEQKIVERMTSLPQPASDPFRSLRDRLAFTLDLFRFDESGKGLIEWAIVQTGLDDPLGRFNRQELEQLFDRWSSAREQHLKELLKEVKNDDPQLPRQLAAHAAPAAQQALRRLGALR